VMYTLAGIVDEEKGWGIQGDTFNCLDMFQKYGFETWFKLGDKDLATHVYRTWLLRNGLALHEVTEKLCRTLGLKVRILPMTNDKVEPQTVTDIGKIHFEEYLVKEGAQPKVFDVVIEGAESANPAPGVIASIQKAEGIVVCPSNPIVSIGPILAVRGIRKALGETAAKIVAVSPIVGGATIKGPADKLMQGLGIEVSAYSIGFLYRDFLDVLIIDEVDKAEKERIERLGVNVVVADTIMRSLEDKERLARLTLEALE